MSNFVPFSIFRWVKEESTWNNIPQLIMSFYRKLYLLKSFPKKNLYSFTENHFFWLTNYYFISQDMNSFHKTTFFFAGIISCFITWQYPNCVLNESGISGKYFTWGPKIWWEYPTLVRTNETDLTVDKTDKKLKVRFGIKLPKTLNIVGILGN